MQQSEIRDRRERSRELCAWAREPKWEKEVAEEPDHGGS